LGVENAPEAKEQKDRLANLNKYFTYSLYENICISLFERHKLLFSFIMIAKINQEIINDEDWKFLLMGAAGDI